MYKVIFTLLSLFYLVGCGSKGGGNSQSGNSSSSTSSSSTSSSGSSIVDTNILRYTETEFTDHWGTTQTGTFSGFRIVGLDYYNSDGTHGTTGLEAGTNNPSANASSFLTRQNATTHFHLGSIEFYTIPSSSLISIFDLLRSHNHKSNQVLNLVRLLMLLDENNSSSNHIVISENSKKSITVAKISLQELFVEINDFQNLDKVQTLLKSIGDRTLPTPTEAESYLTEHFSKWIGVTGYAQWPKGYKTDFDADGIPNIDDDFPWDSTQSKDANSDGKGDNPEVVNNFLETRGVKAYTVDPLNGFLYIANYNKKVFRYELSSGKILTEVILPEYITSMDVNKDTGELYISTASSYEPAGNFKSDIKSGHVSTLRPTSSTIEQEKITLNAYPYSIKHINKNRLVISGLYDFGELAQLTVYDASNHNLLQDISYQGSGGKIIYDNSKLVVGNSFYYKFKVDDRITYSGTGNFLYDFMEALFLDEKKEALVDSSGYAYRLGPYSSVKHGAPYANYGYYDANGFWVNTALYAAIKDEPNNQYLSLSKSPGLGLFFVNKTSSLVTGKKFVNSYDGFGTYWQFSKSALAIIADKIHVVLERNNGSTQISSFVNPCNNCGTSTPPVAKISTTNTYTDIQSTIGLDGATSTDGEDGNKLQYRWDLNGDGEWDTNFSTNSRYNVKYDSAGEKNINLQIMDSSGLSNETSLSINLDYGIYSGEIPESENLEEIDLLIEDAEFDEDRNLIYVTSTETGKVYAINSISGKVTREYHFQNAPTQMALSKEDHMLYLGFNPRGCFGKVSFRCEKDLIAPNRGFVLKFDLAQQAFIGSFDTNLAPADMMVKGEELFISANYWFNKLENFTGGMDVYHKNTGEYIKHINTSSGYSGHFDHILEISDQFLPIACCANTSGLHVINSETNSILVSPTDFKPYHWLLPDHQTVTNNYGSLVSLIDPNFASRLEYSRSFGIRDSAIDGLNNIFIVGTALEPSTPSDGVIDYYDSKSFAKLGEIPTSDWPEWIFTSKQNIIYIARHGNYQYSVKFLNKPWVN